MNLKVENFTNPLSATVIAQKNLTFATGGGASTSVVLQPFGNILSNGVSVSAPAVAAGSSAVIASFNMNLIGLRTLLVIATINSLVYVPPGPTARATLEIWVSGVKIAEQVNPAGYSNTVFTFHTIAPLTLAGIVAVELKLVNGPVATDTVNATISAMEFTSI